MGVPLQLCRSEDGRRRLLRSQRLRFPRWEEGVQLTQSIGDDDDALSSLNAASSPGSSTSSSVPSGGWCLFICESLTQHFDAVFSTPADGSGSGDGGDGGGGGVTGGSGGGGDSERTAACNAHRLASLIERLVLQLREASQSQQQQAATGKSKAASKSKSKKKKKKKPTTTIGGGGGVKGSVSLEQVLRSHLHGVTAGGASTNGSNSHGQSSSSSSSSSLSAGEVLQKARVLVSHAYQVLLLDLLFAADTECRRSTTAIDATRQQLNSFSLAMRDKAKRTGVTPEQRAANKQLKLQEGTLRALVKSQTACRDRLLRQIGNIVVEDRAYGLSQLAVTYGTPRTADDEIIFRVQQPRLAAAMTTNASGAVGWRRQSLQLAHDELLRMIGGVDTHNATAVSERRAYFLRGPAVFLSQALINYSLLYLADHDCEIVQPPEIMAADMMARVAQLDDFEDNLYRVSRPPRTAASPAGTDGHTQHDHHYYLIATAEQPLCARYFKRTFSQAELPFDVGGLSTCFRTEVGSHAEDTRGVFRVHQFEKVEQVTVCLLYTSPSPRDRG